MFVPKDYLIFSKSLLYCDIIEKNDVVCRNIVSRSYYAAFLTTREKIDELYSGYLSHGQRIGGRRFESHKEVIDGIFHISSSKISSIKKIQLHNRLKKLHKYRINADYKFPNAKDSREQNFKNRLDPTTHSAAKGVLKDAERVILQISVIK